MTDEFIDIDEVYSAIIEELKAQNAELLAALKSLAGIEPWIQDREMKEHFQKTVYTAIEKAEKTLPL